MAKKDSSAALVLGGLAALGLLAITSSSRGPTRRSFQDELRESLHTRGLRLVSADLGRLQGGFVWVVTCEGRDGLVHRLQVGVSGPPYEAVTQVADQVAAALGATG